MELQLHEAHM